MDFYAWRHKTLRTVARAWIPPTNHRDPDGTAVEVAIDPSLPGWLMIEYRITYRTDTPGKEAVTTWYVNESELWASLYEVLGNKDNTLTSVGMVE